MSVLCDRELRAEQRKHALLTPFDDDLVQPASIDLRLGTAFRTFRHHELASIDLAGVPDQDVVSEEVVVPLFRRQCDYHSTNRFCDYGCRDGWIFDQAGRFVIHPGEMVLGSTLEEIYVPPHLVMSLEGKSSLARLGLLPHVAAGYFDPGWRGVGTLELVNLSRVPIILRPGLKICQSRWTRMDAVPSLLYGNERLGSHYQGDDRVAGSRYEG